MKARIGALVLAASLAVPAVSFAQDDAQAAPATATAAVQEMPTAAPHAVPPLRDDGAVDLQIGPLTPAPRFGDYVVAPELTNELAAAEDDVALLRPATRRQATALMIAGAALLVAGLIIDNDAGTFVAVAGAAIGAYGLYVYLQ